MDMRFVMDDDSTEHWKARIYSSNQVLLTLPAVDYTIFYNRDNVTGKVAPNVTHAMDDARHAFEENKASRMYRHLLLEFPSDQVLSAKEIYADAGEDEELELDVVSTIGVHVSDKAYSMHQLYAAWTVARTDIKANKRGKVERKDNKSKVASMMASIAASMNTSS